MKYCGYSCQNYAEWKNIISEKLKNAEKFEIHCWEDETSFIELALKYGSKKEYDWSGTIIEGEVTEELCQMILNQPEPQDKEIYDKFTPFFSIFLDNKFFSEHYGTELNEME